MKKKIFLMLTMVAMLACIFAISVSAENALKPQTTNAYGELSFFDESITLGRSHFTDYGFTPYINAEGTTYARVVVGDGTTFYTFPTAYILSTSVYDCEKRYSTAIFEYDFTSLNSVMETVTGKNPGWTKTSIYRIEMPYTVNRVNGGSQNFSSFSNVIEITLQPHSQVQDANKNCIFWKCNNLETINNLDTFVFKNGCLGGSFQNCAKLTNITIGVSEAVTDTGDNAFSGCTSLQSVNFKEAFPNLETVGKNCFYQCTNLTSTSSVDNVVSLPSGTTTISEKAFYECKAIKYVSIPASVAAIGTQAFYSCTSLVFVDFNDNQNEFNVDNWGQFQNCSSLLAVSLPDNYKYIPNRMFAGCSSLRAVYLPKNLERIDTNGWNDDPFNGCTYLYFVQDAFEVRDENDNFYTAESFVQPSKPDVYYMPTTLSQLCTNKTGAKCFTSCYNLNPTIVFGTNMTKTTAADGIFLECGSNGTLGDGITVVFLGDMEQICINTNGNRPKGVKYVFANANDKSLADVNIINNTPNGYNLNDGTEGFYFCNGNCYYLLNGVKYNGTYSGEILTKVEVAIHYTEPKMTVTTDANCVDNKKATEYCFCGVEVDTTEVEGTAFGHSHTVFVDLVYADFSKDGYYSYKCERCEDINNDTVASALFTCIGYSASENGEGGILVGYTVDHKAIAKYTEMTGKSLEYGVFAASQKKLENNDVFGEDGTAASGVINTNISDYNVLAFEIKIIGLTDEHKDTKLAMGAYVAATKDGVTEYSYMQDDRKGTLSGKYYFVSYNDLVEKTAE